MTCHIFHFCDKRGFDFVDDGEDLLVLVGKWADPGAMPGQPLAKNSLVVNKSG